MVRAPHMMLGLAVGKVVPQRLYQGALAIAAAVWPGVQAGSSRPMSEQVGVSVQARCPGGSGTNI